jgi:protocatechuate 3,4-dioxygenase beta subunit
VQFSDPNNAWATQYWQSALTFNVATPVQLAVTGGTEHGGIDATLTAAATISGLVADGAGAPLADICVNANTPEQGGFSGLGFPARTAPDGTYAVTGLPAGVDVRIQFHDCSPVPTHVDQWYDDVTDANVSTPLVLAAGEVRTGIDARLADGIRVGGTVTDASGNPLADIDVNINPDGPGASGFARTDSSGRYATTPVPPGRYRVQFRDNSSPPSWAVTYWQQQPSYNSATLLELASVDAPERVGIDARLDAAASISGTITDQNGQPVANVCVVAVVATDNGPDGLNQVGTAADGSYTFTGLPAAQTRIRVQDCNIVGPYRTQWWPAADSFDAAGIVDLQPGQHRTGVDVQLSAAATIGGTVSDDQHRPLAGICVQATTTQAFGALAQTDGNGNYQMLLNAAGDYTVQFVDCTQQPSHAGLTATGTIAVTLGQRLAGIDATLTAGVTSTLTGSIRNGGGVAVTGACAVVYLANQYALFGPVNADGTFAVDGIPSGTYALAFLGCDTGQPSPLVHDPVDPARTYQAQWWHEVDLSLQGTTEGGPDPIAQHATLIPVGVGQHLSGYDQCFGCQQAPPEPTPPTTTVPPSGPNPPTAPPRQPAQLAITITGHTRSNSAITLAFVAAPAAVSGPQGLRLADQLVASATITYTATCTARTAATASVPGTTSPLTLTGVEDSATYSCVIAAASDGIALGTSTAVVVDPIYPAELPRTGSDALPTAWTAAAIALAGILLIVAAHKPRSTRPERD